MGRLGLAVAITAMVAACTCKKERAEAPAAPPAEDVRPAFDGAPTAIDAAAKAWCTALHRLPAERRAACCSKGVSAHFAEECSRVVSLALEAKTVTLADPSPCIAALTAAHQGCDWVGPTDVDVPEACQGLLTGRVAEGQRCRSTLECPSGLHCRGAGPTANGVCARPGTVGMACELSVDVLASYTRTRFRRSPECEGACQRHRCEAVLESGACTLDAQCPAGQRCGGTCVAGETGASGELCVPGGCQQGLRCVAGRCAAPLPAGSACTSDVECRGACLSGDGGRRCGTSC